MAGRTTWRWALALAVVAAALPAAPAAAAPTGTLALKGVTYEGYAPYVSLAATVNGSCSDGTEACQWFATVRVMDGDAACTTTGDARWGGPTESRAEARSYDVRYLASTGPRREHACLYVFDGETREHHLVADVAYDVPPTPQPPPSQPNVDSDPAPESGTPAQSAPSSQSKPAKRKASTKRKAAKRRCVKRRAARGKRVSRREGRAPAARRSGRRVCPRPRARRPAGR